jgi:hypothetical protein
MFFGGRFCVCEGLTVSKEAGSRIHGDILGCKRVSRSQWFDFGRSSARLHALTFVGGALQNDHHAHAFKFETVPSIHGVHAVAVFMFDAGGREFRRGPVVPTRARGDALRRCRRVRRDLSYLGAERGQCLGCGFVQRVQRQQPFSGRGTGRLVVARRALCRGRRA